jgi:hypothetical protein
MDGERPGQGRLPPTQTTGRTALRDSQRPTSGAPPPVAWPGQSTGRVGIVGDRFQPANAVPNLAVAGTRSPRGPRRSRDMTSSRPYSLPPPAPALAKEHDESKPVHPTSTPSRDSEEPPFRDRLQAPVLRYRICALVESISAERRSWPPGGCTPIVGARKPSRPDSSLTRRMT